VRRFIIPLKYYLEGEKITEGKEFNKILSRWRSAESANELAYSEFCIQLEKLQKKNIWDGKLCKYNECCKKLNDKMKELKQLLKELLDNDYASLINDLYDKKAKNNGRIDSIDIFKSLLIDHCYTNYERRKHVLELDFPWYYTDNKTFDEITERLNPILTQIDSIICNKKDLSNELINILEDILNLEKIMILLHQNKHL